MVEEQEPVEASEESPPPVAARPENTHTIEITHFVPTGQIDARYHDKPYYIAPREPVGQEAFAVIRDAMRAKNVAGLGRVIQENPVIACASSLSMK